MDKNKFVVLILAVALLSGCASARSATTQERNPPLEDFERWTGGLLGAGGGYLLAKSLGANEWIQGGAAAIGWVTASKAVRAAQYQPPAVRATSSASVTTGNVITVYSPATYSSGSCGYGRYENPWSGGCVTQGFVDRNPEYLCCNKLARSYSTVAYTTSERTATETKGSGRRLTADNYLQSDLVPPICQTDNPGADAQCLKRQLPELRKKQKLCNAGSSACPTGFNPGKLAKEYILLAQDLNARQNE